MATRLIAFWIREARLPSFPGIWCGNYLRNVTSHMRAANGTIIEVLGLVDLPVLLRWKELRVSGVASDHVGELLLGIDWLEEQQEIFGYAPSKAVHVRFGVPTEG